MPTPVTPTPIRTPTVEVDAGTGELVEATRVRLDAVGMLASPEGAAAMLLARRLDSGLMDTGSSVAAMVREHAARLAAAVAAGVVVEDPVDELNRKRQERLG